jgi:FlaA1/EpsC-like NDP-sugar epimerase
MLSGVVGANTLGLALFIVTQYLVNGEVLRLSVAFNFWMLSIALVGGTRVLLRLASLGTNYCRAAFQVLGRDTRPKRVVILGAGTATARLIDVLQHEIREQCEILGILDDNPDRKGTYIRNTRVIGSLKHLHKMLEERLVDEVLVTLTGVSGAKVREYVLACRKKKIPVKVVPGIQDMLNGKSHLHVEEISVEDLLRRPPVRINLDRIGGCLTGARVMVTGAGGSIGSELCRQIIALNPTTLILLGHGENSIHQIHQELCRSHPGKADRLRMVVGSVADDIRMDQVFRTHRPQVVFHAAAHKHVPIMEANLLEAVQNNIIGTNCVAECCGGYGAEKMVLISSDKAVAPSSVMGATKWLCEESVRSMVDAYPRTTYVAVRFGNVLGSRGSVVPIFHEAIKRGGPVCVTHPEMTRYFMSIPEAVQLVLQASASGETGALYVLDMGDPVKIMDLACDMIRLCGYEPDVDIPITFSGIRPGEKMHEVLVTEDEELMSAPCEGLFVVRRTQYMTESEVSEMLRRMREMIISGDTVEMRTLIEELVPSFAERKPFVDMAKVAEG